MSADLLALLDAVSLRRAELRLCERFDGQNRMWNVEEHCHPYFELLLFLEGEAGIEAGGRSLDASPSDLVIYPPGLPHTEHVDRDRRQQIICLWADLGSCPRFDQAIKLSDTRGAFRQLFQSIWVEHVGNRRFAQQVIACYLRTLVWLVRQQLAEPPTESRLQVERCLTYIHENYAQDFPVEALAEMVSVSPSYLFRIFRKRMGVTPVHYRNLVRVDRAKHLLLDGTLRLDQIAGRVGFEDVRYFTRVFKKETGASPGEYRKRSFVR